VGRQQATVVTPAEHAATMRAIGLTAKQSLALDAIEAAIVALAERATELEAERDRYRDEATTAHADKQTAEAGATELERERDDLLAARQPLLDDRQAERERAERAETALREIAALDANEDAYHIARAALGETAP